MSLWINRVSEILIFYIDNVSNILYILHDNKHIIHMQKFVIYCQYKIIIVSHKNYFSMLQEFIDVYTSYYN